MGKLTGVIQFNGKVGEVVGAKDSQGKAYIRKYIGDPKNPQTIGQVIARTQFLTNTALASVCKEGALGLLPRAKSSKLSLTNVLQQVNKEAIETQATKSGASSTVDYTKIKFSQGTVDPILFRTPAIAQDNPLKIESLFNDDFAAPNRNAFMVVYCPQLNLTKIGLPCPSEGGKVDITLPQSWADKEVHVYCYVQQLAEGDDSVTYTSYWNDAHLGNNAVPAYASIRAMSSRASYSYTSYMGTVTLG